MTKKMFQTCTWAINKFPRELKQRYSAYCRANGCTMLDHMQYLLLKILRDAKVDITNFSISDLVKKLEKEDKRKEGE